MPTTSKIDVQIHGSGVVGRALALSLARQGLRVGIDARPDVDVGGEHRADVRAYALNAASVDLLRDLRVWDGLSADARTAVYDMRIAGDADGALAFSAWQQTVPALAWIVDAAELEQVLETAIRFAPAVATITDDDAANARAQAALTVIAEGKSAAGRARLGVGFERHAYGHSALAARVVSDAPHAGVARQWFRAPDVLALLPFDRPQPERSYGIVWSMPSERADALSALPDAEFDLALNDATGGAAGALRVQGPRATWPLMQASAAEIVGPGWALVGDAAHVIHPLAGQGLNLGLADVAALARVIAARETWRSLGDEALLRRYARARLWPTRAMAGAVDGLWRLFSLPAPGLRELRNHGMTLVDHVGPLKRFLVARALRS